MENTLAQHRLSSNIPEMASKYSCAISGQKVLVIGAGMAGSDAAYFLASHGVDIVLAEVKTRKLNEAQKTPDFAELVCTNSLKSMRPASGHGMLKYEMMGLNSLIIQKGTEAAVPAGDALAVDREKFSTLVTKTLKSHPHIEIIEEDVSDPIELAKQYQCDHTIVASGPLTTKGLENWMIENLGADDFYFYDAIAPVVDADSLNLEKMFFKNRHDEEGEGDYLNIPLSKDQYYEFVDDLVNADKVKAQNFEEEKFFEACLPIDIMAQRGPDTLRHGPMKPIGLDSPQGEKHFAVIQLRKENLLGSAFNMVGFQNRLTYGEQVRVFKKLPGFENASFNHLGSVHRNSFLNSRKLLNSDMSSKEFPRLYFAGQMTGVEGYTESAATGLYVATQVLRSICQLPPLEWPHETAIGALVNYIMTVPRPTPSNINFGLLPGVDVKAYPKHLWRKRGDRKKLKKTIASERGRKAFDTFFDKLLPLYGEES